MHGRYMSVYMWETIKIVNSRPQQKLKYDFACIKLMRCKSEINALVLKNRSLWFFQF